MEMEGLLDSISPWVIHDFEKPVRKIAMREKHFATTMALCIALVFSRVPLLFGTEPVTMSDSSVTFRVVGTLMQLGTQPFVFAGMAAGFLFQKDEDFKNRSRVLGLMFAIVLAIKWTLSGQHSWWCTLQLVVVSYGMLQAMEYLDTRGSVNFSTALIFAHAAENIMASIFTIHTVWTILFVIFVTWVDGLSVTVPLTHIKRRSETLSMPLPLMYNSTSALIMYSTLLESIAVLVPTFAVFTDYSFSSNLFFSIPMLFLSVWWINPLLVHVEETTGKHLVQQWKKESYTMKGWRSETTIAAHVQKLIDRNINWNTVFLCGMWSVALVLEPSTNITTLFILTSTVKQHVTRQRVSLWK